MQRSGSDQWKASEVARLLALVETERRYYQDLFSALPVPLLLVDSTLAVVMANREFRRRWNLVSADLTRVRVQDVVRAEGLEQAVADLQAGAQVRLTLEGSGVGEQGEFPARFLLQAHRGWDETGADEVLVTVEEPGGAGRAAAPWRAPSPVAQWTLDLSSGHFQEVNEAARHLPVDGDGWGSLASRAGFVHPEHRDAWFGFYREGRAPGNVDEIEYAVSDGSGLIGWRRDLARFGEAGQVAGVTLDITTDRRSTVQLADTKKQESLERLAGRVAHVANNLLMIVSGYAEELMGSLPENDSRRADLQEIVKAGERMAGLTGQLNQLVRPPRFQRESLDLRAWMNALLPALSGLLPGVEIRAGVSAQQVTLETSPAVLNGILMDAAKILRPALQPGMRVELNGAAATGDRAVIWWKVEGGEIPSAVKERFLEPFAGPKEGADPPLGVAGWLRPWQDLGGTLVLEADPAERFLLILTCPGRSCEPGETPPPPKGPRLLVVEDEESIRTLVVRALGREGYEVESMATAGDALQALERAAGEVRLLITDFNMPGMSGLELAEKARAQQPGLRVLLISGATESAQANEALRGRLPEGFAFLQKPFGPGVLVEHVRRMLV